MTPLFDAHLDLAYNALSYGRDLTQSLTELRQRERKVCQKVAANESTPTFEEHWGTATVSLPAMRAAGIRVCLATLLARTTQENLLTSVPRRFDLDYASPEITEAVALGQLAYYDRLQLQSHISLIRDRADLEEAWYDRSGPIGCILSMEGCDPIVEPTDVERWWHRGLRTACLAHYGQGRYAFGTGGNGDLTKLGRQLLQEFRRVGIILDLVHTAERAFFRSLDFFDGPVFVSHANCREIVPSDRQLSNEQIRSIVRRGGIIGVVLDAWMLLPGYDRRKTPRDHVKLQLLVDHIDHICQLAGNCESIGLGSDMDGGFGKEQCPHEIDTISDLQLLDGILTRRGYASQEIEAILHGNWLRFFRKHLPAG